MNPLTGGLLLVPLIGVCIYLWLMAGPGGPGGKSYVQTVVGARETARRQIEATDLSGLYREMQMYVVMHDTFPTKAQLQEMGSAFVEKLFEPHGGQAPMCIYIEGQSPKSPAANVLVYEADIPEGKDGLALLRSGQVVRYSAEDMARAVEQTRANLTDR